MNAYINNAKQLEWFLVSNCEYEIELLQVEMKWFVSKIEHIEAIRMKILSNFLDWRERERDWGGSRKTKTIKPTLLYHSHHYVIQIASAHTTSSAI